jgi:hypothetical protein
MAGNGKTFETAAKRWEGIVLLPQPERHLHEYGMPKAALLLTTVFTQSSKIVAEDAVIYVRTSNDPITKAATLNALREGFPTKHLIEQYQPFTRPTQTHLYGDKTPKVGEVDFVLMP